ncbi:DUF952 domain-containing protein [Pleurocapsa sp. PCC 7319]|uniref:DUF952 domain-containing protein n=1 Tax=Pleurocapsa sp. PCC 7319 TaxID=118161 RepID=UPI000365B1CB|nr:DUF952 domain-containing protein [Pleurocapsa sp. PCC 7319]
MNQLIYHITSLAEWDYAQSIGVYQPKGFVIEQFIHCSYLDQLLTVADHFFRGQNSLVILVVEPSKIDSDLVEENLEGGTELYPHLYGLLPCTAVKKALAFPCNADGSFTLPEELKV